jgi:hypothetical protein
MGNTINLFNQPSRMLDTRQTQTPLTDGELRLVIMGGQTFGNNTVPGNATGIIGNLTFAGSDGDGFLVAYGADGAQVPDTSNLNFTAGGPPIANTLICSMGAPSEVSDNGIVIAARVNGTYVHVVLDLVGYIGG